MQQLLLSARIQTICLRITQEAVEIYRCLDPYPLWVSVSRWGLNLGICVILKFPLRKIRLIIFFVAKDGKALYSQQKQYGELTVAQIMNSLLPNSDLN